MILTEDQTFTKIYKTMSYLVIEMDYYLMQYEWTCFFL